MAAILHEDQNIADERARLAGYGNMHFRFIEQPQPTSTAKSEELLEQPYGTAFAAGLAMALIEQKDSLAREDDGSAVVRNGDDILLTRRGRTPELNLALQGWRESGADNLIIGYPLPRERSRRVGVIIPGDDGMLAKFIEKPDPIAIPGDQDTIIANIGYYGFGPKFWGPLGAELAMDRPGGEHLITSPIEQAQAEGQSFYVHRINPVHTKRFDGGKPSGIRAAGNFLTENLDFIPEQPTESV